MVVVPSWAVTTVVMVVVALAVNAMLAEAVPEPTVIPLTVTVAVRSCDVGVTVTAATAKGTDVVYVVTVPTVPVFVNVEDGLRVIELSDALFDGPALVTAMV
jgi:hypothetical protein